MEKLKNYQNLTDQELISQIVATSNEKMVEELYDRFNKIIYTKCIAFSNNREEAKDLTQDIFIKLISKLATYKGNAKFSTWLYSFTYNFLVNYKKRDVYKKLSERWERLNKHDNQLEEMDAIDDDEIFELKASKLKIALEAIEPADKALLLMKYQDDISIKELQQLLDINESAIKMRLKRAKIKLVQVYYKTADKTL